MSRPWLPNSKYLVAAWRRDIAKARIKLVSEGLSPQARDELWQSIDVREWFIKLVAKDFNAEMETIDRLIEAELRR